MPSNTFEKFLKNIGSNKKIAIWGTGALAIELTEYINNYRKDIQVCFFVSTLMKSSINGIKIYKPIDLNLLKDQFDILIITSYSGLDIIKTLLGLLNINNYLIFDDNLVKKVFLEKIPAVLKILDSKKDKNLYKILTEARLSRNLKKIPSPDSSKQYTEFINPEIIVNAMDLGGNNGLNSLIFKSKFKNCKKIYCFEPMYEKFKTETFDSFIKLDDKIEIIEKGVWNQNDRLLFRENTQANYTSQIIEVSNIKVGPEIIHEIDVTTIDDFISGRNTPKIDFIKMDIENSEHQAIIGGLKTIKKDRPQLAISIYHTPQQFTNIPIFLNDILDDYIFKIGHYHTSTTETVLYAIPKECIKPNN